MVNEFNECVREVFSAAGDIIVKSMMGGQIACRFRTSLSV